MIKNPTEIDPPFGVNELRLTPRQWCAALLIVIACAFAAPRAWKHFERFQTNADYRIPYALSKDYWLFQRRLEQVTNTRQIPVLGDSVVWGEYVRPNGTLTHFLNAETGEVDRFVNGGVNGLFPLALEGLIADFGGSLHDRKVIVQCNPLWLTSPKADLSSEKEEPFNHAKLVPQFAVRIPCYREDASGRMSAVLDRKLAYFGWAAHLQIAYYDQKSVPGWTLIQDERTPPRYVNAWRDPLTPLAHGIPTEPVDDPERGPSSRRHRAWDAGGAGPMPFEWVPLERSLQWQAFGRVMQLLRTRRDNVLVLLGPFNEHMIAPEQRATYIAMRNAMTAWLEANGATVIAPAALPTGQYADASHPLTEGYAALAAMLGKNATFVRWLSDR